MSISNGVPPLGGFKEGYGVKIQRFSSFKRQYLENGSRYGQSYYTVFRKKTPTHIFFHISMSDVEIETKIAVNIPKEQ